MKAKNAALLMGHTAMDVMELWIRTHVAAHSDKIDVPSWTLLEAPHLAGAYVLMLAPNYRVLDEPREYYLGASQKRLTTVAVLRGSKLDVKGGDHGKGKDSASPR